MAKFELQGDEQVVWQGSVGYLKSRLKLVPGELYLTDRRVVHTSRLRALAVGGLIGALMSGKVDFEVPLETVSRLARDKHGRSDAVLAVGLRNGQEYRLLADPAEWVPAFGRALSMHAAQLVEEGPGIWKVATL